MTAQTETLPAARPAMGTFERRLSLWVALCIVAGIALGHLVPGPFGLGSGAALVAVVGVLVEVPVMLSVVRIVKATRPWYERRA